MGFFMSIFQTFGNFLCMTAYTVFNYIHFIIILPNLVECIKGFKCNQRFGNMYLLFSARRLYATSAISRLTLCDSFTAAR